MTVFDLTLDSTFKGQVDPNLLLNRDYHYHRENIGNYFPPTRILGMMDDDPLFMALNDYNISTYDELDQQREIEKKWNDRVHSHSNIFGKDIPLTPSSKNDKFAKQYNVYISYSRFGDCTHCDRCDVEITYFNKGIYSLCCKCEEDYDEESEFGYFGN